jgi:hypothetical protein
MPPDLAASWQARFDEQFPDGALASWHDTRSTATYLIPRVLVTGLAGLDPEIFLPVFAGSDKTLGPFRVLAREEVQRDPYLVRLTLDNVDAPLLLNAGVSEQAALAMAADRESFMRQAPG